MKRIVRQVGYLQRLIEWMEIECMNHFVSANDDVNILGPL
jgi:hypothetical protein